MNRYVVVSGIPASGKSTVGRTLARLASLPLFDKDNFLEAQFAEHWPVDAQERRRMSKKADLAFIDAVRNGEGAVAVSWWRHPKSRKDSGTPTEWIRELAGCAVEVYCRCPPNEAAERFLKRQRHPGHLDREWSHERLLAELERSARLGPIGLDHIVELETSEAIDIEEAWGKVERAFGEATALGTRSNIVTGQPL